MPGASASPTAAEAEEGRAQLVCLGGSRGTESVRFHGLTPSTSPKPESTAGGGRLHSPLRRDD